MLVSGHKVLGSGAVVCVGLADVLGEGVGLADPVSSGFADASVPERPATSHHSPASTVTTTSTTASLRTQ